MIAYDTIIGDDAVCTLTVWYGIEYCTNLSIKYRSFLGEPIHAAIEKATKTGLKYCGL